MNLSATSKFDVCWNDAVPTTVKFSEIVTLLENVLSPVIVLANAKLSVPSTTKLVPAQSVNKLPYVTYLLVPSLIKNWSVDDKSVLAVTGKIGVAVTPVKFVPSP